MRTQQHSRGRLALAKPLYSQVRDMVLDRIRNGEWKAGDTLPNEFVLASQCGVSVGTVRRAVEGLEDSGLLVRKQGRGTYVTGFATRAMEHKFCPLHGTDGQRLSLDYELIGVTRRRATAHDRVALPDLEGSDVLEVSQRVTSQARPVGIEVSLLSATIFPRLEKHLTTSQPLYSVFSNFGVLVTRAEECLEVVTASAEIAGVLGTAVGAPLLRVDRRTAAYDGSLIERRTAHYHTEGLRYCANIA